MSAMLSDLDVDTSRAPEHVATLWKGAGFASRIYTKSSPTSYIVKVISGRAALNDVHVDSYKVEQCFYTQGFSARCLNADITVPTCHSCGEEVLVSETGSAAGFRKKGKKKKAKMQKKSRKKTSSVQDPGDVGNILGSDPRFYSVLTDLSIAHPVIVEDLMPDQASAALVWMAHFHGQFMGDLGKLVSSPARALQSKALRGLWWCGTHWTLERTRHMLSGMERVYEKEYRTRLVKEYDGLAPGVASLGRRLHTAAEALHARLLPTHVKNKAHWYTLLHGDLKGANIALGCGHACENNTSWRAAAFDFQWAGGGLGAQDVAYFFISAADTASLEQEMQLLRQYYQERKIKSQGVRGKSMSWKEFIEMYEFAFLDMMRWLCAYGLWGGPAERWALEKADMLLSRIDDGACAEPNVYAASLG